MRGWIKNGESVQVYPESLLVGVGAATDVNFTFPNNAVLGPGESAHGSANPPPPVVRIERSGADIIVSWDTGNVGTLQQAEDVIGEWQPTPSGANPYTVKASASRKFYRVVIP